MRGFDEKKPPDAQAASCLIIRQKVRGAERRYNFTASFLPDTESIAQLAVSSNPPVARLQDPNVCSTPSESPIPSASETLPYSVTTANIASASKKGRTLLRFYLQSLARELLPDERVSDCLRKIIPMADVVPVMHSPENHSAHYKNLIVCARIWICSPCASKITERRRQELTFAVESTDYAALHTIYTLRHNKSHSLKSSLDDIRQAYRGMKSGRQWYDTKQKIGWIGDIAALEVTFGDNGWHPHIHVLSLLEQLLDYDGMEWLENRLKARWGKVLKGQGRDAEWHYGLKIKTGTTYTAEYIAKYGRLPKITGWTIEHELTKQSVKLGNYEGRSPMQLLADYGDGDKAAGDLFIEYSQAFKGRHQLQWSRGLRQHLGLNAEEKTDEQLAKEDVGAAAILTILSRDDWRAVIGNDARAELLDVAATGDFEQLQDFLHQLGIEHVYRPEYQTELEIQS